MLRKKKKTLLTAKYWGQHCRQLGHTGISRDNHSCKSIIIIVKDDNSTLRIITIVIQNRVWRIYSNIRMYWSQIYIRTFVRINFSFTNIFGHSFVSNLFVQIYSRHSLVSVLECKTLMNIRIYSNIRAIFNTNTCSDSRSCQTN